MTLPASGTLSLSQVNTELGSPASSNLTMNSQAMRAIAGVSTTDTTFSLSSLRGKSWIFSFNITSAGDLRTKAIAAGWNQLTPVVATVTSNIVGSAGSSALTISGSFPRGVQLTINSGVYVVGKGGTGGYYSAAGGGGFLNPTNGSTAISVSTNVNIVNNGVIGGGGGGGQAQSYSVYGSVGGGGGAGNGVEGWRWWVNVNYVNIAGAESTISSPGGGDYWNSGVFTALSSSASLLSDGSRAGNGGALGASGGASQGFYWVSGKDTINSANPIGSIGSGGAAITGNSFIGWVQTGTRYGSIT